MYARENYNKVKAIIDERRTSARSLSDSRSEELRRRSPEIREIDEELRGTGPLIFKTALEGGDIAAVKARNQELVAKRRGIVKKLGYPEDYSDVKYTCPKCSDSGYIDTDMCSCFRELLLTENIKSSGIGRLIDKQSFDNFDLSVYSFSDDVYADMGETLRIAKAYADGFGSEYRGVNLLFMGGTGSGKTHISTAIAKTVIEKGYYVLYDSAQNIISAFESDKFRSGYGQSEQTANKYLDCDLLIIDDLGAEFVNQFTVSCLYNLLNTRSNRGLSTVISTNLNMDGLKMTYDDRIFSRVYGRDYVVRLFGGKDYRINN
jgi:DNA replication protein DnaC